MAFPLYVAFNQVIRGYPVDDDKGNTQEYSVVRPSYLDPYGYSLMDTDDRYIEAAVRHYLESNPRIKNLTVQPYDIIMQIVGAVGNIGLVGGKIERNWIIPQTMVILRLYDPKNRLDELQTLFMWLRDKNTVRHLHASAKMSKVGMTVPVKDLREFPMIKLDATARRKASDIFEKQLLIQKRINQLKMLDIKVPW